MCRSHVTSFVLATQTEHDTQRYEVAHDIHANKTVDTLIERLRTVELLERIAALRGVRVVEARELFARKSIELIQEQCLVSVLEDGQVLELDEVYGDIVLVDEEASEQHERDDEHRSQGHCQLLVTEQRTDDKGVTSGGVIDEEQDDKEHGELESIDLREADGVVHDGAEDDWSEDTGRKLREDLGPEVRRHLVHVVVGFAQEYGSLIWEDEDDVLDSIERHSHGDEE